MKGKGKGKEEEEDGKGQGRTSQNFLSDLLSSSLARNASPRVHAKMLATGLVEVSLPFWCSR